MLIDITPTTTWHGGEGSAEFSGFTTTPSLQLSAGA